MQELVNELANATSVLVITGAGASAESGVSTFRGEGGHWKQHSAYDLASPEGFAKDPKLVWEWYHERQENVLKAKPNPGHYALAKLEQLVPEFTLITQNVDGLHELAGSINVLPIHGDIWKKRCNTTGYVITHYRKTNTELPPKCNCGTLLRPDILWFGEMYDTTLMNKAYEAASTANVILVVGTSGMIGIVPDLLWRSYLSYKAEFNIEPSALNSKVDSTIIGPSGEKLPLLVARLEEEIKKRNENITG